MSEGAGGRAPSDYRLTQDGVDALLKTLDALGLAEALQDRAHRLRRQVATAA